MSAKNKITHTSVINPVDYFNENHVADMIELMQTVNNVISNSIDSLTYVTNKSDEVKRMIVIENDMFVAKMENGLHMQIDKPYTPFKMLQKYIFKDNFNQALNYVMREFMHIPHNYIRVGTKYFKIIEKVDRFGIKRTELKLWDKTVIIDDMGRKFLFDIEKYDDFTIEPDNKNYRNIIGNNYNLYSPFEHKPCGKKEYIDDLQWHWIKTLLEHIFGEQYELGITYLKVLYDHPKQPLPILVLVSEKRSTGKTTFVDFLNQLFGDNMVVINPQDIANSFNGSYADKNIIAIEESRFESVQATEKLKNLSTQKKILVNNKFIQQYSIPFYGKLVITSNDENKFSKVDNPEIRYWVRKVPEITAKANHGILKDMVKEIPYFLHYLNTLPKVDVSKSRMVFEASVLVTEALETVKKESLPSLHKEIMFLLDSHAANNEEVECFYFNSKDIKDKWFSKNSKIEINYINKILKSSIKLKRLPMQRYIPIKEQYDVSQKTTSGRPFEFPNEYYKGTKSINLDDEPEGEF